MSQAFSKIIFLLIWILGPLYCYGQLYNPPVIEKKATPGQIVQVDIHSFNVVEFVLNPDPNIFAVKRGIRSGSNYPLIVTLINEDFTGVASFDIHYDGGEKGDIKKLYSTIVFHVSESVVDAQHDYHSINVDDSESFIDVLANDINSTKELNIESIQLVEKGTAEIVEGGIQFTPDAGFRGMAYVNYVAANEYGAKDNATVTICVLGENAPPTGSITISTSQYTPVTILLPTNGLLLDSDSDIIGSLTYLGDDVIEYTPYGSFTGFDEFLMSNDDGSISRNVTVHVLNNKEQFGPIRNDKVYTEVNTSVSFNIFENDIEESTLVTFPKGLKHDGRGSFTYIPTKDYVGVRTFNYSTEKNGAYYSGKVEIVVNNFFPENRSQFDFVTRKGTPLLLNYNVPINDYSFNIVTDPSHGQLVIYPGSYNYADMVTESCSTVETGVEILRYLPSGQYLGYDEFIIEYCAPSGECDDIKIEVEVIEDEAYCNCVGSDCVWPGDFNGDGKVAIDDILPLGYHFGAAGPERVESSPSWIGELSEDWGTSQVGTGQDLKFIDANGDGAINTDDLNSMSEYYDRYHNLVAAETVATKQYPVELVLSQTTAEAGDLIFIDVIIGSADYPALDIHGLAYTLPLSPDIVDEESITVETVPGNWLGNNSPTLDLFKQPSAGTLDIGMTRTTGISVSGYGKIHQIGIIIEDDLDGVREEYTENKTVNIVLDHMVMTDGSGNRFNLTGASTSFELIRNNTAEAAIEETPQVLTYPNPASQEMTIHVNGNDILQEVGIYSASGHLMQFLTPNNTNRTQIDVSEYADGLYIAKVVTLNGSTTSKFKVIQD